MLQMINNNHACSEHVAEFTSCRLLKTKFIELLEAIGRGHRALSSLKSLNGNQLNNLKCVKKSKAIKITGNNSF